MASSKDDEDEIAKKQQAYHPVLALLEDDDDEVEENEKSEEVRGKPPASTLNIPKSKREDNEASQVGGNEGITISPEEMDASKRRQQDALTKASAKASMNTSAQGKGSGDNTCSGDDIAIGTVLEVLDHLRDDEEKVGQGITGEISKGAQPQGNGYRLPNVSAITSRQEAALAKATMKGVQGVQAMDVQSTMKAQDAVIARKCRRQGPGTTTNTSQRTAPPPSSLPGAFAVEGVNGSTTEPGRTSSTSIATSRSSNASNPRTSQQSTPGAIAVEGINSSLQGRRERNETPALDGTTTTNTTAEESTPNTSQIGDRSTELDPPPSERFSSSKALHASLVFSNKELGNDDNVGVPDLQDLEEAIDVVPMPNPSSSRSSGKEGDDASRSNQCRWIQLAAVILVLAVIMAIVLVFSVRKKGDDNNQQATISIDSSEPSVYPPYDADIPPITLTAIQNDPTSCEHRANVWLWKDPNFATYPTWRKHQRFSMVAQYLCFDGDNWYRNDHWLSYDVSECAWYTSHEGDPWTCDDDGHYITFDLHSNNLTGYMPPDLAFPWLLYVDLSNNQIYGSLPTMRGFGLVEVFLLHNNSFSGPLIGNVPDEIPFRVVRLDNNELESNFIGYLSALAKDIEIFNVTSNRFGGSLSQWKPAGPIKYLGLGDNLYTGSLPSELGLASALEGLDVSGNSMITGEIPSELGRLSNLRELDIAGTSITGDIPEGVCSNSLTTIIANCSLLRCCVNG